jgi:hypothetical protein
MPTPTYTALANITLASSTSTISFSNIPQTYKDLVLVVNRTSGTLTSPILRFNSDSASNYPQVYMQESGGTGGGYALGTSVGMSNNDLGTFIINILDYSATDKYKSAFTKWGDLGVTIVQMMYVRWNNLAAVTSLNLSGTYPAGMTFNLFGVVS